MAYVMCDACGGNGLVGGDYCSKCGGTGQIEMPTNYPFDDGGPFGGPDADKWEIEWPACKGPCLNCTVPDAECPCPF
jgi:rRNA maturation protein Nop10